MTIKSKLILMLCAAVGISLSLAGAALFYFFVQLHSQYAREEIHNASLTLEKALRSYERELLHVTEVVTQREDLIASMNMISEYQSIEDYQPILFDVEKQKIALEMAELARTTRITYIAVYDAQKELSAFVLKKSAGIRLGIQSYHQADPIIYVSGLNDWETWAEATLPSIICDTTISDLPRMKTVHYQAIDNYLGLEVVNPILRILPDTSTQTTGYIKIAYVLDSESIAELAQRFHVYLHVFIEGKEGYGTFTRTDFLSQLRNASSLFAEQQPEQITWLDHSAYFLSTYIIPLKGGSNAYIVLGTDKTLLIASIKRTVTILAVVLLFSALIVTWGGIALANRMLTTPLARLVQAVKAFKEGKYEPVDLVTHDEIGGLISSFHDMADTINQREIEVRAYREHLEDLVELRTLELQDEIGVRQQIEEALRESQIRYARAEKIAHFGHWERNLHDHSGLWSEETYRIFGVTPETFDPSFDNLLDLVHPDDRERIQALIVQPASTGERLDIEYRIIRPDQSERVLHSVAETSFDADNDALRLIGVVHDITARKHAEEQMQEAREAAEKASKAKSEFLANISHEFRTPLNGILGYTQILRRDSTLTAKQRRAIDTIHHSGEHLLDMINDVLDLSKIEAGKVELEPNSFALQRFLQIIVDMARIRAKQKGIAFLYEESGDLPHTVITDEKRLRQVLLNLTGNAIKFTEKGQVTLRVKATGKRQRAKEKESQVLHFEVEDSGIGIPAEKLTQIFLPFEQVSDKEFQSVGTGLGLTISQQIIHLMGSEIQVSSTPGAGSAFWFDLTLPIDTFDYPPPQRERQVINGYRGVRRKLLLVDDKPENLGVLHDMLAPLGFELAKARDGEEAIAKARDFRPDVIFMDLLMPVVDGFEATRRLREIPLFEQTIIIGTSASAFEETRKNSLLVSCDAFVTKPIHLDDLLYLLEQHLQLEWVYDALPSEKTQAQSVVQAQSLPPKEELHALYDAAKIGDILELRARLQQLEAGDHQFGSFVEELRHLVDTFQLQEIRDFLQTYDYDLQG